MTEISENNGDELCPNCGETMTMYDKEWYNDGYWVFYYACDNDKCRTEHWIQHNP
ncbi:MAG: hypothetical protein R6X10_08615 [Desulfobacterales bacterium]